MLNVENRIQYMITFNSNVMIRNLFLLVVFLGCVSLRHVEAAIDIVPKPVNLVETDGRFDITSACSIVVNDDLKTCGELLADYLQPAMGYRLAVSSKAEKSKPAIRLSLDKSLKKLSEEAYRLEVTGQGVRIQGASEKGIFYGIQTLLQLLPVEIFQTEVQPVSWTVPGVQIEDYPRFGWRGFSLDVCRQVYSVDFIKNCIDWLAMHKMNVFHWHLTDNEGWRIEIKKYPELTRTGAWRGPNEKLQPTFCSGYYRYGGFYTQEQIREVVGYAAKRQVMIMPEIEVPGHSRAVAAAYPEILCDYIDPGKHELSQNSWCAANERGYEILGDILKEVAGLFPCPYIHIGGDEVEMEYWENCRRCTGLMKEKHFEKPAEVQNYFIHRVAELVEAAGKKMGGWSEIMDGGELPSGTVVFSWIGLDHGIAAARKGLPVVMMPGEYCYFDMGQTPLERGHYWAGMVPTEKAYAFNPLIPDSLKPAERKNVLGVEGAIWSEMMDRPAWHCEYQMFPRLCVTAEIGWTPQEQREWTDFKGRLDRSHYMRLYQKGIRFRVPFPEVTHQNGVLTAAAPYPGAVIRYTADGNEPTCFSPLYTGEIKTEQPENYRFKTFFTPHWGSIAVGIEKYLHPEMKVTTTIDAHPKCPAQLLADGNEKTFFRSNRRVKDGDTVLFEFEKPLDCRKITIKSGAYQTSHYIITHAIVEISTDGERFIRSGWFDAEGDSEVICTVPIKALRIVFTEPQYEERLVLQDLKIE